MDHCRHKKFTNSGFSLLETLLVIALGTILLVGLSQIYLRIKNNHVHQFSIARLQENARAASAILQRGIRTAGYFGCASASGSRRDGIRGYSSANLPYFLHNKNILNHTDVIVIKKADIDITQLTKNIISPTNAITVKNNPAVINNLWLAISNCARTEVLQANNYIGKTIYFNKPITHAYKRLDTEVARYTETAYFISEESSKNSDGSPIYSLYSLINGSKNPGAHKQALVSGIKSMLISYGVDNNDDGVVDAYYSADQIEFWHKVRSVDITLQLEDGKVQRKWQIYITLKNG